MANSKTKLGRGLDALIDENETNTSEILQSTDNNGKLITIDPRILMANPEQPRTVFSDEALEDLSKSIQEHGVIQPVLITKNDDNYYIVAGERRTRASILAGLTEIPAIVTEVSESQNLEVALIENIQRENLNVVEEAKAYKTLIEKYNLSQEELSKKIGKSRSAIANILRLLQLPDYVQTALEENIITSGHARSILSVNDDNNKRKLFERITNENLSVRATESLASLLNSENNNADKFTAMKSPKKISPELQDIQQQFIDALGTKVVIKGNMKKGSIEIFYFSADELTSLYEKLKN